MLDDRKPCWINHWLNLIYLVLWAMIHILTSKDLNVVITQRQFGAGWRQPHKSHHFCASWHPSSPFAFVSECKILLYEIFSGALCFSTLLIAALFVCIINLTNLVWEGGSWKNCHPNSLFHHLLKPGAILIIMLCCMHAEELDANNCMQTSRTLRAIERPASRRSICVLCLDGAFTILPRRHTCMSRNKQMTKS